MTITQLKDSLVSESRSILSGPLFDHLLGPTPSLDAMSLVSKMFSGQSFASVNELIATLAAQRISKAEKDALLAAFRDPMLMSALETYKNLDRETITEIVKKRSSIGDFEATVDRIAFIDQMRFTPAELSEVFIALRM